MKSLVRWQPFQELTSLQRQMNHLFDNFFGRTPWMPFEENLSAWEFGPAADVYEDDQKLTFKVEVPGIDEKDVKVEVENSVLTVRGERKLENDIKEENFRRKERHKEPPPAHSPFPQAWARTRLKPMTPMAC